MSLSNLVKSIKSGEANEVFNVKKAELEVPDLKAAVISTMKAYDKSRSFDYMFHPSEAGSCSRQVFFNHIFGPSGKGAPNWNAKLKFMLGDEIHRIVQYCWKETWKENVEIEKPLYNEQYQITATCDGLLNYKSNRFVLEAKSTNLDSFNHVMASGPYSYHLIQINLYMYLADTQHGLMFYYCKDNNAMLQWYVKRDDKLVAKLLANMFYTLRCIEDMDVPERFCKCAGIDLDKKCSQYVTCKKYVQGKLELPPKEEVVKKKEIALKLAKDQKIVNITDEIFELQDKLMYLTEKKAKLTGAIL